jgi:hypothetical protein
MQEIQNSVEVSLSSFDGSIHAEWKVGNAPMKLVSASRTIDYVGFSDIRRKEPKPASLRRIIGTTQIECFAKTKEWLRAGCGLLIAMHRTAQALDADTDALSPSSCKHCGKSVA